MSPDSNDAKAEIREEIEKLETRWSENPKGRVFAHLADAYRKLEEYSKAENLILHGLKNHPNYISAYIVLGRIYTDSERYSDAHAQFTKVLEIDPQNLIALKFLGDLAIRGGRLEDARSWYERMLQVDPRNEEAQEALEALDGGPEAIAALQDDAAPSDESPEAEIGELEEGEEPAGMPDLQVATPSGEADAGAGAQALDAPAAAQPGFERPGEPPEPDAATVEAAGEDEAVTWDLGSDLGEEQETGALDETPVDGLMTHDRNERAQSAEGRPAEGFDEVDDEDTMPWDRILDPEDLESSEEPAPDTDQAGMASPAAESAADQSAGGPDELNLDDMDDWTPGFLRHEDMGERQMDDDELFAGLEEGDVSFDLQRQDEDSSEEDSGVVTETMAELYAEQGLFEDALRVYRQLLQARPDDEGLKAKIREIESMKSQDATIDAAEVGADEEEAETPEATGVPQDTPSQPAEMESPEGAPETGGVTPVSGLMSGSGSQVPLSNQDGEGEGEFRFEETAPVDNLSATDPFAGSMDAGFLQEPPAVASDRSAPEPPAPEPEVESEASPPADEAVSAPEPALTSGPAPQQASTKPPAAEPPAMEPPAAEPPTVEPPTAESPTAEPPAPRPEEQPAVADQREGSERVEATIEEYLSSLLDHEAGATAQAAAAPTQASTAAPSEPDSEEGESGESDPEDMAQFQEWLRSLKR